MGGLLGRAKALLGQQSAPEAPAAAPFVLRCVCGEKFEGLRRRESQTFACRECGAGLFVFPVDPLPPLVGKRKKPRDAGRPSAPRGTEPPSAAAGELTFEDDDALPDVPATPAKRRGPPAIMARAWTEPEPEAPPAPRRPFPKKTALALLTVFALVGAAGLAWRQQKIAGLARDLPENARKGLTALQRGQYAEARDALEPAVAALDYGTPFPDAAAVRQGHAESAALADLLAEPLDEALAAAVALPDEFRRLAGRSVLVDLSLTPAKGGRWLAGWTELADGKVIAVDADRVEALGPLPRDIPVRCLVAVRFEKLEKQGDSWSLRCAPAGGALLTEPRTLELLGLVGDAKAAAALEQQRKHLGLPPANAEAKP